MVKEGKGCQSEMARREGRKMGVKRELDGCDREAAQTFSRVFYHYACTEGCHDGYIFLLIMTHAVLCIPSTYLEH